MCILCSLSSGPGRGFDLICAFCSRSRSPREGLRSYMCILLSWPGAPGRGFDLACASCGRGPEPREGVFDSKCVSGGRDPEPREGVSILNVHLVFVVQRPGKGLRSYMCILLSWSEPRGGASVLSVHLVGAARSPGKGLRSYMCILLSWSGAPGRCFDFKCVSGGRFPAPREGASILIVHLAVVVVRSPGKGRRSCTCILRSWSGAPGNGLRS
jgi:hypothetical protein